MLYTKYIIAFGLITFILMLSGCSSISIRTAVEIDATKEKVYNILANFKNYPNWNPYHANISGKFEEGSELKIDVIRPDGKKVEIPPHMMRIVKNKEITWGGGIKGVFYGVHSFILESGESGKTLLKHNEDFSGFAINFADLPPDVIAEGYHQMNIALKRKAEEK